MNHTPSEDLHNSFLTTQDLAFFEEIHKKASHDQIESVMMTLKVVKPRLKSLKIFSQGFSAIYFFTQHIITFV